MKKNLFLLFALALTIVPVMAHESNATSTTTYSRQRVPFTEAFNRARAGEGKVQTVQEREILDAEREEVVNKIDAQKQEYKTQQQARAKRRTKTQKQNRTTRREVEQSVSSDGMKVHYIYKPTKENKAAIKEGIARDFTELKRETLESGEY